MYEFEMDRRQEAWQKGCFEYIKLPLNKAQIDNANATKVLIWSQCPDPIEINTSH